MPSRISSYTNGMSPRLLVLTLLSLLAFSGNSLLCRIALKQTSIDPTSFITVRLLSGALVLWMVVYFQKRADNSMEGTWYGASALFLYAITFAYAYSGIPAGTGALLLFASIQISMIIYGLAIGERLSFPQIVGLGFALFGLVVLMLPIVSAPPLFNGLLMIVSGIAWGAYSLLGRGSKDPTSATAGNFIRAAPVAIVFFLLTLTVSGIRFDTTGFGYALVSGAVTSGLGYILWYAALRELKVTHAATVQLSVPVLTAFGGTIFLGELVTKTLVFSSFSIILGVSLVLLARRTA